MTIIISSVILSTAGMFVLSIISFIEKDTFLGWLFLIMCACSLFLAWPLIKSSKNEDEIIKDYMNGKYKVEIKGTYQDSLFMPSDTIITLK